MDLDDEDVRIGDVNMEENMLGELREQLEKEDVQLYKVEIATNEKYWN